MSVEHPVNSRYCPACKSIGSHAESCRLTARVISERGSIVVTTRDGEISMEPATAAGVAAVVLRRVMDVAPEALSHLPSEQIELLDSLAGNVIYGAGE